MTAVEFIFKKFNDKIDYIPINKWDEIREIIQQALELEKQQIIDAANYGKLYQIDAEKYYDRTYKKDNI
jgi:hypothetical protein